VPAVDVGELPMNQGAANGFAERGKTKAGNAADANREEDRCANPVSDVPILKRQRAETFHDRIVLNLKVDIIMYR